MTIGYGYVRNSSMGISFEDKKYIETKGAKLGNMETKSMKIRRMEDRRGEDKSLYELCETVRTWMLEDKLEESKSLICSAMGRFPDAAQPHNLMGILLERLRDTAGAMRHFRAASALDPTYAPARQNLERVGTFTTDLKVAFDDKDCRVRERGSLFQIEYDESGVGRMVRG